MPEVFTYRKLPSVEDRDPKAVKKIAELLVALIDFEIPGAGIVPTSNKPIPLREAHNRHRNLVLRAAGLLKPQIDTGIFDDPTLINFNNATPTHTDSYAHLTSFERLALILRLHTADENTGARVIMANTAPGLMMKIGDEQLFGSHGYVHDQARFRGYEGRGRAYPRGLLRMIETGTYDPVITEPTAYHYDEQPLSSVLFRSMASMGPVTAHGFWPLEPGIDRLVLTSDISVYSQACKADTIT